ncbi:MAG: aldo/keto reductase, partial [Candidatus Neomarinimicrobiota bacterium]|nr:aldo/keto reductase [Candidatus Neomarinimicrobiota bacterium]
TAQFGMDYGITNIDGKPKKKEVFDILDLAWKKGIRCFDSAPGYGSEALLGEFITANGIQDEAIVLTKIPSLYGVSDFQTDIITNLESSLKNIGCPINVLFFHNPVDSGLLMSNQQFFETLLNDYPVSMLGVSVYETKEVESLSGCQFELAFQFPFNVLDRRFEQVSMPQRKRFARSVFIQGLLASTNDLRLDAPVKLLNLQKEYHDRLAKHHLKAVDFAVSFVANNDAVDYFLFGVDTEKQLQDILDLEPYDQNDIAFLDTIRLSVDEKWLDPRNWS